MNKKLQEWLHSDSFWKRTAAITAHQAVGRMAGLALYAAVALTYLAVFA